MLAGTNHPRPEEEDISASSGAPVRDRDADQRTVYLHAGTHKTGTTSIQRTLTANHLLLGRMGFTIPRAGRSASADGHHNVAWELAGDDRFEAGRGSLHEMLQEIAAAGQQRAIVSSEDFEYLHARPDRLRRLADGFADIGYAVAPVIYLRPQAGYAESLYAELVKHGLVEPFDAFLETILATGEYRFGRWCFTFDYARLLEGFAAVFGPQRLIVRRYTDGRDDVVDDFLRVIGADALSASPERVVLPRLNTGSSFARVLEQLECNVLRDLTDAPDAGRRPSLAVAGPFDPVHLREAFRVTARFNAVNRRVFGSYRVAIPCVSGADLCADFAGALGVDAAGRLRKQLIVAATPDRAVHQRPNVGAADSPHAPSLTLVRVWQRLNQSPLAVAARRETIAVAAALAGAAALVLGPLTQRTALTEFGLLSGLAAAMAAARLIRCALAAHDTLVDERFFAEWALRLTMAGYGIVALYAAVNALLDVGVPRYGPDGICLRGAAAIALAVAALRILVSNRAGVPPDAATHDAFPRPSGEGALIAFGCIALALEPLHAVRPVWWLDTIVDALAVAVTYGQYRALWRRLHARGERVDLNLASALSDARA